MKRFLLPQMRNELRSNLWMLIEIAVVAIILFAIFSFYASVIRIKSQNYGYDTNDVLVGQVKMLPTEAREMDCKPEEFNGKSLEYVELLMAEMRQNPYVELVGVGKNAIPYDLSFWRGELSYTQDSVSYHFSGNGRDVSPDVIRIFRLQSTDGKTTEELAKVIEKGDIIVGEFDTPFIPNQDEAKKFLNKTIILDNDSSRVYHVGAVSKSLQRDDYEGAWGGSVYIPIIGQSFPSQVIIRVKPGKSHDFLESIAGADLTRGWVYFSDIKEISKYSDQVHFGINTLIRNTAVCAGFMLLVIFLGFLGTFWFRTQQRVPEIAVRKVNGATKGCVFRRLLGEGMILLAVSVVPALVVGYYFLQSDIAPGFVRGRQIVDMVYGALTTVTVLVIMIVCGIYFPARVAMNINPAEALKDQ